MHFYQIAIASVAAFAPFASAVGTANILNKCSNTVYVWSVGSTVGARQTVNTGGTYSETYRRDPVTGGIALKIKTSQSLSDSQPQTIFSYTLDPGTIWYDLSDVMGDQFAGKKLEIAPSDQTCSKITWSAGTEPAGDQTEACSSDSNLTLTLCA